MKSPKLWAFSHRVEHLFFCQAPPKKSTVAVLDFGPVGRLRRRWLSGMRTRSACHPVVAVLPWYTTRDAVRCRLVHGVGVVGVAIGPRCRGGARSVLAMAGHARRGCRRWDFRQDTPGRVVMPRNAVKGCHAVGPVGASGNARGRGHRKHPGGEVLAGDGRGAVGSRSAPGFLY